MRLSPTVYPPLGPTRSLPMSRPQPPGSSDVRFAADPEGPVKRWFKRVLYTAAVAGASFGGGVWYATPPNPNKVVKVYDGDTFTLASGFRVRIYGIDAPEMKQSFGPDSQKQLESMLLGKVVDLEQKGRSLDRKVCIVYVGHTDIGGEMVRLGYAFTAQEEYNDGRYEDIQAEAKSKKLGLWGHPGIQHPSKFREQQREKHQEESEKPKHSNGKKKVSWLDGLPGFPGFKDQPFALVLTPYTEQVLDWNRTQVISLPA